MSRRIKTQLPTADALLKPHMETNLKEMLTMKRQLSQKYYDKKAHKVPALREGDVIKLMPNPGDKIQNVVVVKLSENWMKAGIW